MMSIRTPKAVLPWRQVHLDFHTSEHIPNIGVDFDAEAFGGRLSDAGVESIVLFGKCHHGWSYYNTTVGARHPGLDFNLLDEQVEACRAAGIKVVLYVSVGWDEREARAHVDWRQVAPDGSFRCLLGTHLDAAWKYMCLGTPYLDTLTAQITEIVGRFPDADGLWLDIIKQEPCVCVHCQAGMTKAGLDWLKEVDRESYRRSVLNNYLEKSVEAALGVSPDLPIFHNTSMVPRGDRKFFEAFSHIEIESLPTGGWGYDHLPMAAKYAGTLPFDRLGVTARFHIVWGELGGWKHPNALRYEICAMLTHGTKICIGDHLDPSGRLDATSYRMIGDVFAEGALKQQYCDGSRNVADLAILSSVAVRAPGSISRADRHCPEDEGALRILNEGHLLFDVIDSDADFSAYRLIVMPDRVLVSPELKIRLDRYLADGGKLMMTAQSGMASDNTGFALPIGARLLGPSPFNPTFIAPREDLRPAWIDEPIIVMAPSMRISVTDGVSLGSVYEPWFNRSVHHFNGHINAPAKPEASGFDCGVRVGNIAYLAQPLFSLYRELGSVAVKHHVLAVIADLLGEPTISIEGLPSAGTVTLRRLPDGTEIIHLLYATPALKGSTVLGPVEVIEDLPDVGPIRIRLAQDVVTARLVPDGTDLAIQSGTITVDRFSCHQMIELKR